MHHSAPYRAVTEADFKAIEKGASAIIKKNEKFERVVLTKAQALDLFRHNPFKVQLISNKIPDGGYTTAYRCGHLIDLCMGPHLPQTSKVTCFAVTKNSAAYWLGSNTNDSLQRVYGVAFPDKKKMALYKKRVAEAKMRDHRKIGNDQNLFFFHELSPGSCFFQPRGAYMYNKLQVCTQHTHTRVSRCVSPLAPPSPLHSHTTHTRAHCCGRTLSVPSTRRAATLRSCLRMCST